ncbi:hypothetical protein KRZ98_12940 [Sphingobium sp. AS12]|uniref:hypothetical protein n=1 Tax=Sphingobium sp. AS12 TaxID=2849495 RepID=UPI001C314AAE|nr:hypothetical protein [Sphingobium sp. AS12]MBV2149180.1 hypothetical protein [Sphingobium sp. AS12]
MTDNTYGRMAASSQKPDLIDQGLGPANKFYCDAQSATAFNALANFHFTPMKRKLVARDSAEQQCLYLVQAKHG